MKLVFCGTPSFAVPTLEALLAEIVDGAKNREGDRAKHNGMHKNAEIIHHNQSAIGRARMARDNEKRRQRDQRAGKAEPAESALGARGNERLQHHQGYAEDAKDDFGRDAAEVGHHVSARRHWNPHGRR